MGYTYIKKYICVYTTTSFIYLLIKPYVVSASWLLQTMLLWTWGRRYLSEPVFLLSLHKHPAVESQDQTAAPFMIF